MKDFKTVIGKESERKDFIDLCRKKGIKILDKNINELCYYPFFIVEGGELTFIHENFPEDFVGKQIEQSSFLISMNYLNSLPDKEERKPKPPQWLIDAHNSLTPVKMLFNNGVYFELGTFYRVNMRNSVCSFVMVNSSTTKIKHPFTGEVVVAEDLKNMDLSDLKEYKGD